MHVILFCLNLPLLASPLSRLACRALACGGLACGGLASGGLACGGLFRDATHISKQTDILLLLIAWTGGFGGWCPWPWRHTLCRLRQLGAAWTRNQRRVDVVPLCYDVFYFREELEVLPLFACGLPILNDVLWDFSRFLHFCSTFWRRLGIVTPLSSIDLQILSQVSARFFQRSSTSASYLL